MIEDDNKNEDLESEDTRPDYLGEAEDTSGDTITKVTGMYRDWFLDYASYVILERAVPAIEDGFKPVQRRIMHSLKDLDDGRYNKVANIVGHTMQYHPHGDASIADAMVQIGQKDLLIDTQGTVLRLHVTLKPVCQNLLWMLCTTLRLRLGNLLMMGEERSL